MRDSSHSITDAMPQHCTGPFGHANASSQSGKRGNSVTLTSGETIWLRVLLQTPSASGSCVDASRTLVAGWNVTSDLVPAAARTPVHQPSSWALFGLGSAALAAWRRRRALSA
jgi:hypothetical protein